MMTIDLENASIQLYEDISLTDELDDSEAQTLLKWGEQQLSKLATDEAQFEQNFKALRQMLKRINRMVGRRADLDDDDVKKSLGKFVESAQQLGYSTITPESAPQLFELLRSEQSQAEVLQGIIDRITPLSTDEESV